MPPFPGMMPPMMGGAPPPPMMPPGFVPPPMGMPPMPGMPGMMPPPPGTVPLRVGAVLSSLCTLCALLCVCVCRRLDEQGDGAGVGCELTAYGGLGMMPPAPPSNPTTAPSTYGTLVCE